MPKILEILKGSISQKTGYFDLTLNTELSFDERNGVISGCFCKKDNLPGIHASRCLEELSKKDHRFVAIEKMEKIMPEYRGLVVIPGIAIGDVEELAKKYAKHYNMPVCIADKKYGYSIINPPKKNLDKTFVSLEDGRSL